MPAPMMHTFALVSSFRIVSTGVRAVAIQTEVVVPEVGCMLSFTTVLMSNQTSEEHATTVSIEDLNMLALKRGVRLQLS